MWNILDRRLLLIVTVLTFASTKAAASVTSFANSATWQAAVGSSTDIDFSTDGNGNPLTSPTNDIVISPLTILGVSFGAVRSYWNLFIYTAPNATIHTTLPPNTYAASFGLGAFYNAPGTFTVTLSSGESWTMPAASPSWGAFVGVVSTAPLLWIDVKLNSTYLIMDNFSFKVLSVLTAAIDVRPGSIANNIAPISQGMVPVAILSSGTLNASLVDVGTVRFGITGTEASAQSTSYSDVNGDGLTDAVTNFRIPQTGIVCGTTVALLKGNLQSGQPFQGSDSVTTVGCH